MAEDLKLHGEIEIDTKKANEAFTELEGKVKKTFDVSPLSAFESSLGGVTGKINSIFGTFAKISALAAGGFGLTAMVQGATQAGESLYKLSNRFGMTVSEAATFNRILSSTGSDAMTAARALGRLDNTLASSGKSGEKAKAVLDAVGVTLTDSEGRLLPYNDQLKAMAEGYEKAEKAGVSQEFVLNTLGMRGMALVGTLKQYNEVAKIATSIKGVGLNADEMHELNRQIQQVNMQFGSLKLVAGVALAPLAHELLEEVIPALQDLAKWLGENKEDVVAYTKTIVELIAIYEGLKLAAKAYESVSVFKKNIEDAYAAAKAVAEAEAEKQATVKESSLEMEADAERVGETMSGAFEDSEQAANKFGTTATAQAKKVASEATISANTVKTQYVEAYTAAQGKIAETTATTAGLTAVTEAAGNASIVAGEKTVAATVSATSKVQVLTKAVFALAGGWIGVAVAIGEAAVSLYNFYEEEKKKAASEKVYTYNGKEYQYDEKDHTMLELRNGVRRNVYNKDENNAAYEAAVQQGLKLDENGKIIKDNEDATKKNTEALENFTNQYQEIMDKIMAAGESDSNEKTPKGSSTKTEKVAKNNEQQEGESNAMYAMRYLIGNGFNKEQAAGIVGNLMQESGGGTFDLGLNATDGTAQGIAQWQGSRLENLRNFQRDRFNGEDTLDSQLAFLVYEMQDSEKGAYNQIKGTNNARDAAYVTDKYYERSAGTERGKRMDYAQEAYNAFTGEFGEYDASGAKGIIDRQKQIDNAKKQLEDLEKSLDTSTKEVTATQYENQMQKLDTEIENKKKEIKNIKEVSDDIDTSKAEKMLETYKNAKIDEINKEWAESLDKVKEKTTQVTAEATSDYKTLAQIQYENTVKQAERDEEEQIKKLSRYKDDVEAKKVAEDEKTAKVLAATKEREQAIRDAFERTANARINDGDEQALTELLNSQDGKDYFDWQSKKAEMQEYYDEWKKSHLSVEDIITQTSKTMQSSLDTFFQDAFIGTKSLMDSVYSLVSNLFKSILSQFTQKWSAQITTSILGGLTGKNGKGNTGKNAIGSTVTNAVGSKAVSAVGGLFGGSKNNQGLDFKSATKSLNAFDRATKRITDSFKIGDTGVKSLTDTMSIGTEVKTVENTVTNVMGATTKPAEAGTTEAATSAMSQLTSAAISASVALNSVKAGRLLGAATGGAISGIGTSTSDSIPAMLSDGEFVLRAEAVNRIGVPTLNALNEGRIKHFSAGGVVSSVSSVGGAIGGAVSINISAIDGNSVRSFLKRGGLKEIKQGLFSDTRNFASNAGVW